VKQPLTPNKDFTRSPVEVIDLECHYLTGTKAQPSQQ
jgi:hypothetical protein